MNAVLIWVALIGLAGSLLFSTLSYALRMMSRVKMEEQLTRREKLHLMEQIFGARHELSLASSALRLISNAVVIITVAYYFQLMYKNEHSLKMYGFALLITVPALLVTSVAIPQAWAKYAGEGLIAGTWGLLRIVGVGLYPLVAVMNVFDEVVRRLAGVTLAEDADTEAHRAEQEVLAAVSEGTAEGAMDEEQKMMIEGVIGFRDLQVGQIMTPRTDVVAVEVIAPVTEVRDKILKEGLSRVPVFEGTLDNVVGILYAKDLLKFLDTRNAPGSAIDFPRDSLDVRKLMRPPLFVPATKPLRDLLREMKLQQVHMAIVLDEYGGTAGLVTTEDIVEEIVGDIADEYERPEPEELRRISDRVVEVDARMSIAELNRQLDLELPTDQDFNTLGGFVISTLGSIPVKGEVVLWGGTTITVIESEPRRVKKVRVELPERGAETGGEEATIGGAEGA